ncbi:MAG: M20/M25/M40 family metallo-hydrolase [Deltaproteobacteria bacterium]|nr:M20/M25/M40 family metallo-hydrolase [Deltaproteobacteria bacterium]
MSSRPPFCGEVHDGCLWGRGAIDMKNMVAMSVAIMAQLAREGVKPKRDLIFAAVADEEAGCRAGIAVAFGQSSRPDPW